MPELGLLLRLFGFAVAAGAAFMVLVLILASLRQVWRWIHLAQQPGRTGDRLPPMYISGAVARSARRRKPRL